MAHISGGEVTYGRTVKTGDYENKRIDVKLTFGCDEGEDVEAILNRVSTLALYKAHEILGLRAAPAVEKVLADHSAKTAAKGKEGAAAITTQEKAQTAKADKPPAVDASQVVDERPPNISTGNERVAPDELDIDNEAENITDAQLTDAAKSTNKRINNPVAIKALRDKYAGKSPSILSEIPKEKRKTFLDELEGLK